MTVTDPGFDEAVTGPLGGVHSDSEHLQVTDKETEARI